MPVMGMVVKSLMAAFWGRFFAARHRTPRTYTVIGRVLDAVSHVVIFSSTTSIEGFLFGICVHNLLLSPRSFWSISA